MDEKPTTLSIEEEERDNDGCDVAVEKLPLEEITSDDDLPVAKGGVV